MAKIKICGITSEDEIGYLNEAGVEYAGFVQFYPKSKRNIPVQRAVELMRGLDSSIQRVAVTVSPDREQLAALAEAGFDLVQIHGDISGELLRELPVPAWKAFNVRDLSEFRVYQECDNVEGFVFDAQIPGSGQVFDWSLLPELPDTPKTTMLAGGLHPGNVADALRRTGVDGVDTSSGVENELGNGKSREKIQAFVRAVRGVTVCLAALILLCLAVLSPVRSDAHGTSSKVITRKMLRDTPPATYKIDETMQGDARDGEYNRFFLQDGIQTVRIEIDENNLNYLFQNADKKPSVMANSVNIGGESIGYPGLKTKGSYTLEHTFNDYYVNDRFSFTINFGKYVKKEQYGENQNFYGCKKISFNNFFFDKSMMREFFCWKLLTEMGLPSAQYGLAKLYINDQYYGVYFMVEALDQALLSQHYGVSRKDVGDYITKPEESNLQYDKRLDRFCAEDGTFDLSSVLNMDAKGVWHASGILEDSDYLWEKDADTLQDVAEMLPTVLSWQKKLNALSGGKDFDGKKLDVNSEEYLARLNEIMDVDEVVRYFAVHSFLVQLDDMFVEQHNFGLYIAGDGKSVILPWDYDLSFGCYYPSTAELTANFDLDMMYKGLDPVFMGGEPLAASEVYPEFPLFHVIFQNSSLMEKYHGYMRECAKIAAFGGTTSLGKNYEPAWFNRYIEALSPLLEEAAAEEMARNAAYLNHTNQPEDMKKALPNLAKIIAMRAAGVLSQTDGLGVTVSGEGCDLSTLGNAIPGESSRGGKLAAVDAATGIFVTADYGDTWTPSPKLTVKKTEPGEEVFGTLKEELGCDDSELTVYSMTDGSRAEGGYRLYLPLGSECREKEVSLYSWQDGKATELAVTVDDSLYMADTDSIECIAVVAENAAAGMEGKRWIAILLLSLALLAAAFGIFLLFEKKAGREKQ